MDNLTTRSKRKYKIIIFSCLILFQIATSFQNTSAADKPDRRDVIDPGKYMFERITLTETEEVHVQFQSNKSTDIFILDEQNLGLLLLNHSFSSLYKICSNSSFDEKWDLNQLNQQYNVPIQTNNHNSKYQDFYIAIINNQSVVSNGKFKNNTESIQIWFSINFEGKAMSTFADVSRIILIAINLAMSIFLFIRSYQYRKEKEEIKNRMIRGYALGITFAFINLTLWEISHWFFKETGENWIPELSVSSSLFGFTFSILQLTGVIAFGPVILSIMVGLEKSIRKEKIPFISISIVVGTISLLVGFFVPVLIEVGIILYAISIALGSGFFVWNFIKLSVITSGRIRAQALLILIGMIVFVGMNALRGMRGDVRDVFYIVTNIISMLSMVAFYYGAT
jgi:hypothetical protein